MYGQRGDADNDGYRVAVRVGLGASLALAGFVVGRSLPGQVLVGQALMPAPVAINSLPVIAGAVSWWGFGGCRPMGGLNLNW